MKNRPPLSARTLSRRTLLRGLGAAVSLPVMESLIPSALANTALENRPKKLSVFYIPNGLRMPKFTPATAGNHYEMTPILEPIARHREKFSVITGLAHYNANALGDGPGSHGRSCGAYLTGAHPKRTEGADIFCGISMDQVIANHVGQHTQLASLELGIEPSTLLGSCDVGYSCTYTNTLSWRSPTAAMPVAVKPGDVFERLFGDTSSMDEATRQARLATKASVLDFVLEDAARLSPRLGMNDRRKLEEYLDSIRTVEQRIQKSRLQSNEVDTSQLVLPAGIPQDFTEHVRIMIDLQVLALQSDMTRVSTFMLGRELSNRSYAEIGVPDSHHSLSHHGGDEAKIDKLVKINQLHMAQFGYLLDRLSSTADGERSLLDSTLVFGGASLGEPNVHDNMDLPALIAGGGLRGGRHIQEAKDTPMSNLLLSLMHEMGVPADQFGDSTGRLHALHS